MRIYTKVLNQRLFALLLLILGLGIALFIIRSETAVPANKPFHLGLDLSGGSYLVYNADVSKVEPEAVKDSMAALRDVIERRVNLFGVSEPRVSTEVARLGAGGEQNRLVVELPGVTDLDEAVALIGQTPLLEFKTENPDFNQENLLALGLIDVDGQIIGDIADLPEPYLDTPLTGQYLKSSRLDFQQAATQYTPGQGPVVVLEFTKEGGGLFAEMTRDNIGKTIAIYLDGSPISTPVVQAEITGGEAIITGAGSADEAKQLVGRLNSGALPVPIELASTQTIGPSLGHNAVTAGVRAGIWGFALITLILLLWYRLPGLLATVALAIYAAMMLALFKIIPVTLTAAGIAGFIISLGIAVDANILIFERMKEELRAGRTVPDAVSEGFRRAWPSIRDANVSSLISALILFWFGSSLIQGFALTFGLGVLVSMVSAITLTRQFLIAVAGIKNGRVLRFFYSAGLASGQAETTSLNTQE